MDAANNSNTPVPDYLGMPILRFYEIWNAICATLERRADEAEKRKSKAKQSKPRKAKRKRR